MKPTIFPSQYVPLDLGHPLAEGLIDWIQPAIPHSAIRRIMPTTVGTATPAMRAEASAMGRARLFGGGGGQSLQYGTAASYGPVPTAAAGLSILCVFRNTNFAAVGRTVDLGASGSTRGAMMGFTTTNFRGFAVMGATDTSVTGSAADSEPHAHLFSVRGTQLRLVEDGGLIYTNSAAGAWAPQVASSAYGVGGLPSAGASTVGHIVACAFWHRWLSDMEALQITAQPDLLLMRRPRRMFFFGGSTADSVTMTAASFSWSPQAVKGNMLTTLTAATFSWLAQAVRNLSSVTPAAATFSWSAKTLSANMLTTIAAAVFSWAGQAFTTTANTIITMTAAVFSWSAQQFTATGVAAALFNWLIKARRRGRR